MTSETHSALTVLLQRSQIVVSQKATHIFGLSLTVSTMTFENPNSSKKEVIKTHRKNNCLTIRMTISSFSSQSFFTPESETNNEKTAEQNSKKLDFPSHLGCREIYRTTYCLKVNKITQRSSSKFQKKLKLHIHRNVNVPYEDSNFRISICLRLSLLF